MTKPLKSGVMFAVGAVFCLSAQFADGQLVYSPDEAVEFPQSSHVCKLKLGEIVENEVVSPLGRECRTRCKVISSLKGKLPPEVTITFNRDGNGLVRPETEAFKADDVYVVMLKGDKEPFEMFAAMRATETIVEPSYGDKPGDRFLAELAAMCASDDPKLHRIAVEQMGMVRDLRGEPQVNAAADSQDPELARAGVIAQYRLRITPDAKRVMELFDRQILAVWYEESGVPQKDVEGKSIWRREDGISILERGLPEFDYATYVREGIKHKWIREDDHTLYVFFGVPWKVQRKACVPELVKLLDDPDKRVRWWAVLCLTHTIENEDRPQWEEYAAREDEEMAKWRRWWNDHRKEYAIDPAK
jgi:hypothetical protein